jgi:hypothetical protein
MFMLFIVLIGLMPAQADIYESLSGAKSHIELEAAHVSHKSKVFLKAVCVEQLKGKVVPWACFAAGFNEDRAQEVCVQRVKNAESIDVLPVIDNYQYLPKECLQAVKDRRDLLIYKEKSRF